MKEEEEFDFEQFFIRKIEEIPGSDLLIFSMGAVLGFNGYTPLTALLKVGGATGQTALEGLAATGGLAAIGGPIGALIAGTLFGPSTTTQQGNPEKILGAMIGALESYALTRPGVAVGIAEAIATAIPL